MRSTGARVDLDPIDRLDSEAEGPAVRMLAAQTESAVAPRPAERAALPAGTHELLLVKLIAIAVTLAAAYGIETERKSIAIAALAATAVVAAAVAVRAHRSARTREELRRANERLQHTNAELRAFHLAVIQGFALIDERTNGRLTELVEEAGDELAELIDDALDEQSEEAQ
jgi:hypothetical protein